MSRTRPAYLLLLLGLVLLPSGGAVAGRNAPSPLDEVDPSQPLDEEEPSAEEEEDPRPRGKKKKKKGRGQQEEEAEAEAAPAAEEEQPRKGGKGPKETPAAPTPPRELPPPILAPKVTDAKLLEAYKKWSKAQAALDSAAATKAQTELLTLKEEVGALNLDTFALGFLRAAEARRRAQDEEGGLLLNEAAVALAPGLPYVHVALAQARAHKNPADVGTYAADFQHALGALLRHPRYLRPALADLGTTVLMALMATASVVVFVLFLRRARYLMHDVRHLLLSAIAPWQAAALVLLLLSLPIVLRLGVVPMLLALLGSVALYLPVRERAVGAVLVLLVGCTPLLAGQLVSRTTFAGTVAEDVLTLESGGVSAEPAAGRVRDRHAAGKASFPELFALGRYEARRGLLTEAIEHFKAATALRTRHAPLLTNLANALFASGNEAGAVQLYVDATQADPSSAAAYYNLSHAYHRRAMVASDDTLERENAQSSQALAAAHRLDRSLLTREPPAKDRMLMNLLVISPPLPPEDMPETTEGAALARRVEAQLARTLTGRGSGALPMALGGALLVFFFGFAGSRLGVVRECDRCGRSVCRRCDKELGLGSKLCAQCVYAFARKGAVAAPVRVRKQLEITRYKALMGRVSFGLGALVSGAGHIFSGLPLRGSLYAFLFLLAVCGALFHRGVLRVPHGELPALLKLVPLALLLIPLHLLTLRGILRRQGD